jgi:enediyne biosynthesis protein E4
MIGAGVVVGACLAVAICHLVTLSPLTTHHSPLTTEPSATPGLPWFVDVTARSGIDFAHFDPATPRHYIQETMGSGLAWIDYDNDGWLDLFCVQDGPLRPASGSGSLPTSKLYRNNGDGTFTDVTREVGLDRPGFGMGCAVGDFDNDGFDDLVVTYWSGVVLYHNEPDGQGGRHFVDVTARAGLDDPHWATSCAWGDIDGDGFLDLYICNYCEVDLDKYPDCKGGPQQQPISCAPTVLPAVTHRLYRNNGDGTFTDVSESSGIAAVSPAPGLGVVMVDLDGDGRIDIYVANDMRPAYLFHNQGGGRFVEKALFSGCGLGPGGREVAGMGVAAGDVDDSGRPSLFVTNFQNMPNVLYRNAGGLLFHDWTERSGLGPPSIDRLGFGTVFCDFDLDGRLDVAVANGHVSRNSEEVFRASFAQEAQLFLGLGSGRFRDISASSGGYFRTRRVGRGLAWADYDNDGKPDLAFSHNGGPLALLHNQTDTAYHWIRLELVGDGKKSNRNAIGARVEIESDGVRQVRFINGGGSYLSASDRRLLVGLGTADGARRVTVSWPSGARQEFSDLPAGRWWRLHEGKQLPEEVIPRTPR